MQAVAKLHGSPIELSDQSPGLRVSMTIAIDTAGTAQGEKAQQQAPVTVTAPATLASMP